MLVISSYKAKSISQELSNEHIREIIINEVYTSIKAHLGTRNGLHITRTWNFVNSTENNNGTGTGQIMKTVIAKGIITFGGTIGFKETVCNKTIWQGGIDPDPVILGNSDLLHALAMTGTMQYGYHPVLYKITILNPNHIELTDGRILDDNNRVSGIQNGIIHLMRLHLPSPAFNDCKNSNIRNFAKNGGSSKNTGTNNTQPGFY